jgi:hypothetical protein
LLVLLTVAGAEPTLRWLARGTGRRAVAGVAAVVGAAMSAVVGLPVLPVESLEPAMAMNAEQGEQVGWREFTTTVADVWDQIPAGDQGDAVIFTSNYGQAGAIERYHDEFGMPAPYSGHMSYADWGPPPDDQAGPVVLVGDFDRSLFTGCERIVEHDNGFGVDNDEQGTDVWLCTAPSAPWSEIWPDLRRFY